MKKQATVARSVGPVLWSHFYKRFSADNRRHKHHVRMWNIDFNAQYATLFTISLQFVATLQQTCRAANQTSRYELTYHTQHFPTAGSVSVIAHLGSDERCGRLFINAHKDDNKYTSCRNATNGLMSYKRHEKIQSRGQCCSQITHSPRVTESKFSLHENLTHVEHNE